MTFKNSIELNCDCFYLSISIKRIASPIDRELHVKSCVFCAFVCLSFYRDRAKNKMLHIWYPLEAGKIQKHT